MQKKPGKAPLERKTIFDDSSSEDDIDNSTPATWKQQPPKGLTNLASSHISRRTAQEAQAEDASIYDYDNVYESLHVQPQKRAQAKGPKYMQGLLEAAEIRKRDQLQAKDKMLAKERQAEGEQYAGKETFVTGAYKAQQEEVRKLAEEEEKLEAEAVARRRKAGGGMTGLYKGLLEREDERRATINKNLKIGPEAVREELIINKEPEPLKKEGAEVMMNDEGQVVDKRELLSAGLNIKPKPRASEKIMDSVQETIRPKGAAIHGNNASKVAMRERQTRMLESQLEQTVKRVADDERVEQEAFERAAKSKKTKEDVSSAKERYLQRKKKAEVARRGEKGS